MNAWLIVSTVVLVVALAATVLVVIHSGIH